MTKAPVPGWGWVAVLAVIAVLLVTVVLDWLDGAAASPDHYLIGALAWIAGVALGLGTSLRGGGKGDRESGP